MKLSVAALVRFCSVLVLAVLCGSTWVSARTQEQGPAHGGWNVPESSVESPFEIGVRAHTNHVIHLRPANGSGLGGGMTPTDIKSFYGMPATGGSGTIAIIGAFDYPGALTDFNYFSSSFGLPVQSGTNATASSNQVFQVVYARGYKPRKNTGWSQEAALDIEWSHAMAPNSKIVLVEAASNSFADLSAAVDYANTKIPNLKHVSMSWGASEFSSEGSYDSHFQAPGVIYFASSGDTGGVVNWPSVSPLVVAVGGTSVATDAAHAFTGETGWSGSGGGNSVYLGKPGWQVGNGGSNKRSVPDISSDADPNTGVLVRWNGGWYIFGGTSVSSPCMAGMANTSLTGQAADTSTSFLTRIYGRPSVFRDILTGTAGSFSCTAGWDFVTGLGSPQGVAGFVP